MHWHTGTRHSRRFFLVVVTAFLGLSAAWLWYRVETRTLKGQRISGDAYDGLILQAKDARCWQVTDSEVRLFEAALTRHVQANKAIFGPTISAELHRYKRHYWGFTKHGHRLLCASFFHEADQAKLRCDWLRDPCVVDGGGDHFWDIAYDLTDKCFKNFSTNSGM